MDYSVKSACYQKQKLQSKNDNLCLNGLLKVIGLLLLPFSHQEHGGDVKG